MYAACSTIRILLPHYFPAHTKSLKVVLHKQKYCPLLRPPNHAMKKKE